LLRMASLKVLSLNGNLIGDRAICALVAPPPDPEEGPELNSMLSTLERLLLDYTLVTGAGCHTLMLAITSNRMPALQKLSMRGVLATDGAKDALHGALLRSIASRPQPVAKFLDHARIKLKLHLVKKAGRSVRGACDKYWKLVLTAVACGLLAAVVLVVVLVKAGSEGARGGD